MNIVLFPADPEGPGPAAFFLTGVSIIAILVTLPLSLCLCIKVITILAVVLVVVINFVIIIMYHNWCTCPGAKVITILVIVIKFIMMVIGAQVVQEYERAVIFRLGRLRKGGAKVGPTYNKDKKGSTKNQKGPKRTKKY